MPIVHSEAQAGACNNTPSDLSEACPSYQVPRQKTVELGALPLSPSETECRTGNPYSRATCPMHSEEERGECGLYFG
jgi:hypothetical protein